MYVTELVMECITQYCWLPVRFFFNIFFFVLVFLWKRVCSWSTELNIRTMQFASVYSVFFFGKKKQRETFRIHKFEELNKICNAKWNFGKSAFFSLCLFSPFLFSFSLSLPFSFFLPRLSLFISFFWERKGQSRTEEKKKKKKKQK